MSGKNLYIDGKPCGAMIPVHPIPEIYFGVQVSAQRAEFLARVLDVPLCKHCGRVEAEWSGDPWESERIYLGEIANCNGCYKPFDPHHLSEAMYCPQCEKG